MACVLGVDPSLRATGYGVIRGESEKNRAVGSYGTVVNPPSLSHPNCLERIFDRLSEVIASEKVEVMAIESTIYVQSYKTAIILGAARGSALLAAAKAGVPVFEYAPKRVKQAVVGRGAAGKHQVGFMVRALLGLTETPESDAADALAVALTHTQASSISNGLG